MAAINMPANPSQNQIFDAQNNVSYIWDGQKWNSLGGGGGGAGGGASVNVGVNPPTTKKEGDLWYNTEDGVLYVWYVDPTQIADSGEGQWVDTRPGNEG